MKQNQKIDDEAMFILTKLGVTKKLHPEYSQAFKYMDMEGILQDFYVNYFNQKSLAFEPLIEPYQLIFKLAKEAPYVEQVIKVASQQMLNINLTYGVALTVRKIIDRVQESFKQAEILEKLKLELPLSVEELKFQDKWNSQVSKMCKGSKFKENQLGYIFQNFTGLPVRFTVHDSSLNDNLQAQKHPKKGIQRSDQIPDVFQKDSSLTLERVMELPPTHNHTLFRTQDELFSLQQDVTQKLAKGKVTQLFVQDPLKIDFKIGSIDKLSGIPIEGLGVHSYIAHGISITEPQQLQSLREEHKKKVGVIINVKQEGLHKKINIESQLLLANNNSRPITLFIYPQGKHPKNIPYDYKFTLDPNSTFRTPLTWLLNETPYSLYLEGNSLNYLLFENLIECFPYRQSECRIRRDQNRICRIEDDYYTCVDIQGYKCLPDVPLDGPMQYLVSFDPPLKVTNYHFRSIDIRDAKNPQIICAALAPKETAFLNNFDTQASKSDQRPDIMWSFYETPAQVFTSTTKKFTIQNRLNQFNQEGFCDQNTQNKSKGVLLDMELRTAFYQDLTSYDENFEFRTRLLDISTAVHQMIFPRFMLINKTSIPIISQGQTFIPISNDYFNSKEDKVRFKVPGYKKSKAFDITTVGLAGSFDLELKRKNDVPKNAFPQSYVSQKLEFGLKIQAAPAPFNKTTLINIVPRYVIINQLNIPIIIRQCQSKQQVIVDKKQLPFSLELSDNQLIRIREPQQSELNSKNQLYEDLACDDAHCWSSPFSIEEVDDFQVSFHGEQQYNQLKQWYEPQPANRYLRYVRVVVTTQDDSTILIVICNPLFPEYEIVNKSNIKVYYGQMQESKHKVIGQIKDMMDIDPDFVGPSSQLMPKEVQPFVWIDKTRQYRRLLLKIGNEKKKINIDKALKRKTMETSQGEKFNIEVRIIGNAKKIKISSVHAEEEEQKQQAELLQKLLRRYQGQQFTLGLELKGIGLSFIDNVPKELLYLSVYNINVIFRQMVEMRKDMPKLIETISKLEVYVQHLQLDNMINQIMPVVLAPTKPLIKRNDNQVQYIGIKQVRELEETKAEESKGDLKQDIINLDEKDDTPFIQLVITKVDSSDFKKKSQITWIRTFTFGIQEFIFQVETSIINDNLKFVQGLIQTFTKNDKSGMILANYANYESNKLLRRVEICTDLDSTTDFTSDLSMIKSNKMFMEFINLGALKAIVTFQLEKKAVEIDISNPQKGFGVLNILYSILASIVSISNSNLRFKELIIINTFSTPDMIIQHIIKNYTRQAITQFYKIIGSSDLIGNPLGLVDKLGTGVIELFNEPRKGLMQGPEQFVGGIGKGVRSLTTNVVSGGMESISKVTGSLYTVLKNVSGEEKTQIQKPEHAIEGVYQGVKGGLTEIVGGVTGLFTKPIEKTRQEGAKGLFKGIGSGFIGLVSAPLTATLRAGSSITQGVASSAQAMGSSGKVSLASIQHTRFRPARYINPKNVIDIYNEDIALVSQTLTVIDNGNYANQSIRYFATLLETKPNGEIVNIQNRDATIFLITDEMILYFKEEIKGRSKGSINIMFKTKLRKIQKCEVFIQELTKVEQMQERIPDPIYVMVITYYSTAKGQRRYVFKCYEYQKFEKIYNLISMIPTCEAIDSVRKVNNPTQRLLECCF